MDLERNQNGVSPSEDEQKLKMEQPDTPAQVVPGEPKVEGEEIQVSEEWKPAEQAKDTNSKKTKKEKKGILKSIIYTLVVIAISVGLAYVLITAAFDYLGMDMNAVTAVVEIPKGATTKAIASILEENDIIDRPLFFRLCSKIKKADGTYQYGKYELKSDMSYDAIIAALQKVTTLADTVQIVIPEGLNAQQIAAILAEKQLCTEDEFINALQNETYDYPFLKDIDFEDPLRYLKLEGYLFPDSYDFAPDATPKQIVDKMLETFDKRLTDANLYEKIENSGFTLDEIITLASIIQMECSYTDDMPLVSSVFHNRLAEGSPLPKLQSDVTVLYVNNYMVKRIENNQPMYDAYDTYTTEGLTEGPITNPGIEAIEAAVSPSQSEYYYFVTDINLKFYYAKTFAEHQQNVAYTKTVKPNS